MNSASLAESVSKMTWSTARFGRAILNSYKEGLTREGLHHCSLLPRLRHHFDQNGSRFRRTAHFTRESNSRPTRAV